MFDMLNLNEHVVVDDRYSTHNIVVCSKSQGNETNDLAHISTKKAYRSTYVTQHTTLLVFGVCLGFGFVGWVSGNYWQDNIQVI